MKTVSAALNLHQSATAKATNSAPLNVEAQIGRIAALTGDLVEDADDAVGVDRALDLAGERPRVNSSMTFRILSVLPSRVWSNWKSAAQMAFGRIGHIAPVTTPTPRRASPNYRSRATSCARSLERRLGRIADLLEPAVLPHAHHRPGRRWDLDAGRARRQARWPARIPADGGAMGAGLPAARVWRRTLRHPLVHGATP